MKHGNIAVALLFFLFLVGCVNINFSKPGQENNDSQSNLIRCGNDLCETGERLTCASDCQSTSFGSNDPPWISSSTLTPSNPGLGQVFTLSLTAQDDGGVRYIYWTSSKPVLVQGNPVPLKGDFYDCAFKSLCTASFSLSLEEAGELQLVAYADDSVGLESARSNLSVVVQSFRRNRPQAVCGNNICESSETEENCLNDCLSNCPSPGGCNEPEPSTIINVNDGGTGAETVDDNTCSSDSDCGYKQICSSGTCESVQCTNDSQCSGCKRCSGNSCRSCGYGAYGVCTC